MREALYALIESTFPFIKPTQLIGILAGCFVFFLTISAVISLLIYSGTFSRFVSEIQSGMPIEINLSEVSVSAVPELYDHLLEASKTLPSRPECPELDAKEVLLREYKDSDADDLYLASNGSPQYHESAYDPGRIWLWWINIDKGPSNPSESVLDLRNWINRINMTGHSAQFSIVNKEFKKPIGLSA